MPEGSGGAEGNEPAENGAMDLTADVPPAPSETDAPDSGDASPADTGVLEIVRSLDENVAEENEEAEAAAEDEWAPPEEQASASVEAEAPAPAEAVEEVAAEAPTPEVTAEAQSEAEAEPEPEPAPEVVAEPSARIPWWPFALYGAAWVIGLGTALYLLLQVPTDRALIDTAIYGYTVLGGLVLTALGPLMILVTWFVLWLKRGKGNRKGLFSKVALYGSLCTLAGVLLWWGMLMLLDQLRLGQLA